MTNEQIIEMAKQSRLKDWWDSGNENYDTFTEFLHTFAQLVRNAALEDCANVCDEMHEHYTGLKDTALLNRDVDLSNAMSGEPRACEFIAQQIRSMKK